MQEPEGKAARAVVSILRHAAGNLKKILVPFKGPSSLEPVVGLAGCVPFLLVRLRSFLQPRYGGPSGIVQGMTAFFDLSLTPPNPFKDSCSCHTDEAHRKEMVQWSFPTKSHGFPWLALRFFFPSGGRLPEMQVEPTLSRGEAQEALRYCRWTLAAYGGRGERDGSETFDERSRQERDGI